VYHTNRTISEDSRSLQQISVPLVAHSDVVNYGVRVKRVCRIDLNNYDSTISLTLPLKEFLAQHRIPLVPYSYLYSPQTDAILFHKLERTQKGKRFMEVAEIIQSLIKELNIHKRRLLCILHKWQEYWNYCVQSEGRGQFYCFTFNFVQKLV
jgi:hypothetical protein